MKERPGLRTAGLAAAVLAVVALAIYLRLPAFTAPHTDPVELAYVHLAMKMGSGPGLSAYDASRISIQRREVAEVGPGGRQVPVAFPARTDSAEPRSFDGWPAEDTNLFRYKPPFFPSLLTYAHHRVLGPRFPVYPVSAAERTGGSDPGPVSSRALFQMQGWAVSVPFLSGVAAVILTLVAGWRMFGPPAGILAALILAAHPAHTLISGRIWPEATLGLCVLASYLFVRRFAAGRNAVGCVLAGAAWALGALSDPAAFWMLPGLALILIGSQKRSFYRYWLTFAAGAWLLYQVWPAFVRSTFSASVLERAAVSASPVGNASLWLLAAASIVSTAVFLKCRAAGRTRRRETEDITGLWLVVGGYIAARLLIGRAAAWDERALAPILPFAALITATITSAGRKV